MIMDTIGLSINNYISYINRESEIHIPQTHPLKVMDISLFKVEVCQIDELFAQVEKPIILDNRDICGIPLTEEWLLKFGMRRGNNEYFFIHRGDVGLWNDKGKFTFDYSISMCGNRLHINHVHQLQNLYFALTQTELEIK